MVVPVDEQHSYYGRKHITTTNCMCTCDFDIKFTFACVGQEGSTYNTRIFLSCLNNESYNFPKAPASLKIYCLIIVLKYVLCSENANVINILVCKKVYHVDSGYPIKRGFLAPYKGERYHLPIFSKINYHNIQRRNLIISIHHFIRS